MRLPYYYYLALLIGFNSMIGSHGHADEVEKSVPQVSQIDNQSSLTPEAVREIAEIQRRLGGSIVGSPKIFSPQAAPPETPTPRYRGRDSDWTDAHPRIEFAPTPIYQKSAADQKVDILRAAATQLDVTASRLEAANLYSEADQLRDTAHDFRLMARKLRSQAMLSPAPAAPQP